MSRQGTDSVSSSGNTSIDTLINNDYFFAVVAILAFSYGHQAKLEVPVFMVRLFSNDIFRVFYLSLLLIIRFETRPTVAIIMGLVFIYMLKYIQDQETKEAFANIIHYEKMKSTKIQ